jgi:hypothetical protein
MTRATPGPLSSSSYAPNDVHLHIDIQAEVKAEGNDILLRLDDSVVLTGRRSNDLTQRPARYVVDLEPCNVAT